MFRSLLFIFISIFILSGCGGGTSSSSTVKGVAQLGYISGGTVNLYEKKDLTKIVASTTTSKSTNINEAGSFTFENIEYDENEYYILEVIGGYDIDSNDDGIIDTSTQVELKGKFYAIVGGNDLINNSIRITALSDMAYLKIKDNLQNLSNNDIQQKLNEFSNEYLYDINEDNIVNHKDLNHFNPTSHRSKTKKSYSSILNIYVPKLHNGDVDSSKITSLLAIDKPRIIVENGNLQEVPFNLNVYIENLPEGVDVKWNLNNVDKSSLNEEITSDGIYVISASLYKDNELLKIITSEIIATKKVEIASIDVDITKENSVHVSDESNSTLTGTQIIIPKGALEKETKIIVKKSSVNATPNTNGISISDVLTLEPSGLTFEKPVLVKIPYSKSVDLENKTVQVIRYSDGGKIDYISPLYIDKEKKEVVFETEHFTDFELKTSWGRPLKKAEQDEIVDIQTLTGLSYDLDKWEEILNTNVINDDTTVYDLYLKFKSQESIYNFMKNGQYRLAYEDFLTYNKEYDTKNIFVSMSETYKELKGTYDTYSSIKDNLDTLLITKKYYKQIASNLGLITDYSPASFISTYNEYVFGKIFDIIDIAEEGTSKKTLELFFKVKNDYSYIEFDEFMEEVEKSSKNRTKSNEFFSVGDSIYITDGWLTNADGSNLRGMDFTDQREFYYSLNALWELNENFKKYSISEHKDNLKTIIEDISNSIDLVEASDNKKIKSFSSEQIEEKYSENEKVNIDLKLNTYGYTSDLDLRVDIVDINNNLLTEDIDFNCRLNEPLLPNNYCSGDIEVDTSKLSGNELLKLKLYEKGIVFDKYIDLITDRFIHLRKKLEKKTIAIDEVSIEPVGVGINENGDFEGKVIVKFNSSLEPNYDVEFKIGSETYGKDFTIPNSDLKNIDLENIEVRIIMPDSLEDTYIDFSKLESINLKEIVENSLNGVVDESKSRLEILKHNASTVLNENLDINLNDTVTFKLYKNGYSSTINKEFSSLKSNYEIVSSDISNDKFDLYTVKFLSTGSFDPFIEILLINNKKIKLYSPRILVKEESIKLNSRPVSHQEEYTIEQNKSLDVILKAFDEDGDILTYIVGDPRYGSLKGISPNLTYTPKKDFVGKDTFLFKVSDGEENSKIAIIIINVEKESVEPIGKNFTSKYYTTSNIFYNSGYAPKSQYPANDNKSKLGDSLGNCTWYANGRMQELGYDKTVLDKMKSNASTWASVAIDENLTVSSTPKVGSIAQASANYGSYTSFGHVAVVEEVNVTDQKITISESSFTSNLSSSWNFKYRTRIVDWDEFDNYIYIDEKLPSITLSENKTVTKDKDSVFTATLSKSLDSRYSMKISFGDGGGGYLDPKLMTANSNKTLYAFSTAIGKVGNRVYRVAIFDEDTQVSTWVNGTYTVNEVVNSETITHNGYSYETVISPTTGRVWLDRNIGASRVCTSATDELCFGDYFQWGRNADGHEKLNSNISTVQATNISNVGNGNFVQLSYYDNVEHDWAYGLDSSGELRETQWNKIDGTSICPVGFRVPNKDELNDETHTTFFQSKTNLELFSGFLKLPSAGQRFHSNSEYLNKNDAVYLWTSSADTNGQSYYKNYDKNGSMSTYSSSYRTSGYSVRCIEDDSDKIVSENINNTVHSNSLRTPNGGEEWNNGEIQTIQWSRVYISSAFVDLYVLNDSSDGLLDKSSETLGNVVNTKKWYKFASKIENNSSYELDPALLNGSGNDYMILIVASDDKTKWDISDGTFSLNKSADSSDDNSIGHNGFIYNAITSSKTGRVWLDRNIGATKVCNSDISDFESYEMYMIDQIDCFGDYYQAKENNGNLNITNWEKSDGTSICPVGFRVPNAQEFFEEITTSSNTVYAGDMSGSHSSFDTNSSFLNLPFSGYKNKDGNIVRSEESLDLFNSNQVSIGSFWTSDQSSNSLYSDKYYSIHFFSDSKVQPRLLMNLENSFNIRCIKNEENGFIIK